jgi:segregation and condensation protein B
MDKEQLKYILEALIFASDTPIPLKQLSVILADVKTDEIEAALADLKKDYAPRALILKKVAGGFQFTTKPQFAKWVGQMFEERARSRLSRAALESLAIVAFKQPISRVEVSAIRGVGSEGVIKKLLDARLITIAGRDSGPGRALLFKTTPEFLHYFGINEISDLPRPKEVEELLAEGEGGALLRELPDEALLTEDAIKAAANAANDEAGSGENETAAIEENTKEEKDESQTKENVSADAIAGSAVPENEPTEKETDSQAKEIAAAADDETESQPKENSAPETSNSPNPDLSADSSKNDQNGEMKETAENAAK